MQISENQLSQIIRAVEHYTAYLRATKRDDHDYQDLAESLKRNPHAAARSIPAAKQQRATTHKPRQRRRK